MRKLVILGVACATAAALFSTVATAQHRGYAPAPQYRSAPMVVPRYVPQYRPAPQVRINPGVPRYYNRVGPGVPQQHFANLGRHGLPMVHGMHGWHEMRNRTQLSMIPGAPLSDGDFGSPVEFDSFIDSIDLSDPPDPLTPCSVQCGVFGAISVSNDGLAGWASGYATMDAAQQTALQKCLSAASEACTTQWVRGTTWLAGIHCDNSATHWSGTYAGDDAQSAVRNVYRFAFQQFGYASNDCAIDALIAGNGAQQQFVQKE